MRDAREQSDGASRADRGDTSTRATRRIIRAGGPGEGGARSTVAPESLLADAAERPARVDPLRIDCGD